MKLETYKGRKLKATKGKSFGKSRIVVNGTECGEWIGTQSDVIEWEKRTINDVDARPFEGRWGECWYAPGTYELNENGHVVAPGGVCSCGLCKTEPENSMNIEADHRGKIYRRVENGAVDDELIETLSETIEAFFAEVDPKEFETEDLAHSLLRALKRDGFHP